MLLDPPQSSPPVRFSRRDWPMGLLILGIFAAVAGGFWYQHHHRYKHFAVHEPGKVYRCGWVEADVMAELVKTYRVKTVLNLCRPGEMGPQRATDERKAVEGAGGRLIELSLPDTADPYDPRIAEHKQVLQNPLNYPIIIHCQHGVNRTARTIAMYEVLVHQADGEAAVHKMPHFGRRKYEPLEYEFARNFTTAFRHNSELEPNKPPQRTARRHAEHDDGDGSERRFH